MYLYSSLRERSEEIDKEMIETEREGIYFKALAPAIMGAGKSEICRAGQQSGDAREKNQCCNSNLKVFGDHFLLFKGPQSFLKAFYGHNEAHPHMEDNLLYSKSTDLDVNHV